MTKKIEVDWGLCESNGVCMGINPEIFELGDDDMLTVHQEEVTPENEADVREAVRQCPRQAISIVERRADQNPARMTALQSAAAWRSFAAFW